MRPRRVWRRHGGARSVLILTLGCLAAGVGAVLFLWPRVSDQPPDAPDAPHEGRWSVAGRLQQFGLDAGHRLAPAFAEAGVAFPPRELVLAAFKEERRLDVIAPDASGELRRVLSLPVYGASGGAGPKLREGDRQVPEGEYGIELLNPNSRFHVSLRLNYPSPSDLRRAVLDGRPRGSLGGDIMIHGGSASIGCLAMGDPAAEELFALSAWVGLDNVRVLVLPWDFRSKPPPDEPPGPDWVGDLYRGLQEKVEALP